MFDSICDLLNKQVNVNEYGDPIEELASFDTVFCEIASASFKEKEFAQARGQKAELTIRFADRFDYNGQEFIRIGTTEYKVIDTYYNDKNNEIKLVVTEWQSN